MHPSSLAQSIAHDLCCKFGMENAQVLHPGRLVTVHAPTECHWRPIGRTNHFSAHFSLEPRDSVLCGLGGADLLQVLRERFFRAPSSAAKSFATLE
jgi:hypothetical protein